MKSAVDSSSMMALLTAEMVASLPKDLGTSNSSLGFFLNKILKPRKKKTYKTYNT